MLQQFIYRCIQEMKKCVQSISRIADHENYDAFFLCVMSHGAARVVYGVDGVGVGHQGRHSGTIPPRQVQSPMWETKGLPDPGMSTR